ncbi:MlaD family protein [Granulicella cerasi]|uniref:MlaD family protein n=1 Tax=Granulicella cerasi TaxID=741063 RepID=A0ABW1ZD23_9BACT|nr:MlaD family protein [Granulicella cerasi]
MPSQQELKWSQLKVGVLTLASLALLCILLFLMTSASGMSLFTKKIIVDSYFSSSNGLKKGGEVQLEGVTIGEVTHVQISHDPARKQRPVHVIMKLSPKYQTDIHADSIASLGKVGLVGDTVVNLDSRTAVGPEIQTGMTLPVDEGGGLDAVMSQSKDTLATLNTTLTKLNAVVDGIQQGQGTVGQLIKNRELFDNLNGTIRDLHLMVANINAGRGSAGKLLHDDAFYNHLNDTAAKLDSVATNLQQGKGSAGKLLTDDSLYNNLNQSVGHLNSLLAEADAGKGALGLLSKDPAFARKLDHTVTNLDDLLSGVNQGKGTLGKFATDPAAYNHLDDLLKNSNELVTMFRQDPKKYLTIHMKVF